MTAQQAIEESIRTDQSILLEFDKTTGLALFDACEGCTIENDGSHDFWGTDEDGNKWRVRMEWDKIPLRYGF